VTRRTADEAIARLSRKQHGAWSRRQAMARSLTPKMVRTRLANGSWVSLDNGVYGHVAAPPTWERSVMAAILAEPWAAASHRCGAVLHELPGFRRGRPEITVPAGANARGRLAIVHRGVDVPTTTVRGIPVVRKEQVVVDLAQVVSEQRLRTAVAGLADRDGRALDAVRDRYCALAPKGGRDLRPLRAVLERFGSGEPAEPSELELRLRTALRGALLQDARWEAPFPGRAPGPARVDALVADLRLVVEADGRTWHTRIEDFERDRRRDAEAAAAGYLTLRFTWHQLTHETRWVRRILLETAQRRLVEVGGMGGPDRRPGAPNVRAA
jgi:very-short-patch-repair endonuclease